MGSGAWLLTSAGEPPERTKQRHGALSDRMTAAESLDAEFGHKALEKKLAAAGIGEDADRTRQVMARIKARQASEGQA